MNGPETSNWIGDRSTEITREAFGTYLDSVEDAARSTTQMTEQGLSQAGALGQQGVAQAESFG